MSPPNTRLALPLSSPPAAALGDVPSREGSESGAPDGVKLEESGLEETGLGLEEVSMGSAGGERRISVEELALLAENSTGSRAGNLGLGDFGDEDQLLAEASMRSDLSRISGVSKCAPKDTSPRPSLHVCMCRPHLPPLIHTLTRSHAHTLTHTHFARTHS